jgi:hypothetical protein
MACIFFHCPQAGVRFDSQLITPYNMGVNAEVFLYEEKFKPQPKTIMMFYRRLSCSGTLSSSEYLQCWPWRCCLSTWCCR